MDQILSQAGLSLNQTRVISGEIRASLGKSSISSHYRNRASASIHLLEEIFNYELQKFFIENNL